MKMKLEYMKYIAACCLFFASSLLTGCEGGGEPQVGPSIGFDSDVEESRSRAPMVEHSTDEDFTTFAVWGNYTEGGTSLPVYTYQQVTRAGSTWTYSPAKTWILTATGHDFSACSPHDAGTPVVTGNKLSSIDFDCNAQQVDLIMACTTVAPEDFKKEVKFNFSHALVTVSFTFKLKEGHNYVNTYGVSKVQLGNLYTQGHFTLNANKLHS